MNAIALIERDGWLTADLNRAAIEVGMCLTTVRWSDLSASLCAHQATVRAGDIVLNDSDAVFLRTMRMGTFEQVFFRMDLLHRLEAAGVPVVNPPRAIEVSVDKYMALALVREAGVPTPETFACQKYADAMSAFDSLGGDVVLKPMFGSQGFGLIRISDQAMAQRAMSQLERMGQVAYLQKYIEHGDWDLRLFVLDDHILAAMRRRGEDWRTNIALGGNGEPVQPGAEWMDLARRSARACGAQLAGVDLVIDPNGDPYILEVNAIPGWRQLAKVSGTDITTQVLRFVADRKPDRSKTQDPKLDLASQSNLPRIGTDKGN